MTKSSTLFYRSWMDERLTAKLATVGLDPGGIDAMHYFLGALMLI